MVTLYGTTRTLPDDGDVGWGEEIRDLLTDICKGLDTLSGLVNNQAFLVLSPTEDAIVDGSTTLTVQTPRHDLKPSTDAPARLVGIGTEGPISSDLVNGQTVLLVGHKDATEDNYVYLDTDALANVSLNGNIKLRPGVALYLMWDTEPDTDVWRELARSN
mgnify:CR=1 FL=1